MTRAREVDSATCWGRHLAAAADSIFLEKFGSGPRRSLRRSAERPARAAWAALQLLADGRHRGDDGARALAANGAGEPRGHRQGAAPNDQRFRARVPPLYPLTRAREGRADLSAVGQQRDPLAPPAGRRRRSIFAQFGSGPRRSLRRSAERPARAAWAALQLLADGRHRGDDGARALAANGAGEPRGHRQGAAPNDQRFRARVPPLYPLTRAREGRADLSAVGQQRDPLAPPAGRRRRSIFAQFGSGPRRSLRRSAERPARAAWAALQLLADGRHRGDDGARALAANGAGEPRGHRQGAAPNDQRFRAALAFLAPNPRARGALGDQTDPLEPAGRRFGNFVFAIFPLGANAGARAIGANAGGGRRGAGRAQDFSATGSFGTDGIERSGISSGVSLSGAESSCARRAGRSDRPARAGWAALRQFRFRDIPLGGERWSSGDRGERWWRPPRRRARAGFFSHGVVWHGRH